MNSFRKILPDRLKQFQDQCAKGSVASITRLSLENNVKLSVFSVAPTFDKGYPPVIFVPGLVSVPETFSPVVKGLSEDFKVHYIETREKRSAEVPAKAVFGVKEIALDLSLAIEKLGMTNGKYLLVAYSLGATASAEAFVSGLKIKPVLLVLIEPSAEFRVPPTGLFIARYFAWSYRLIKPLIKLYLRTFMMDVKKDYEMYMISVRALDSADAGKLAGTLVEISHYRIWEALAAIDVPSIVIGASNDTFHSLDDSRKISALIKGSEYIDLVSNDRSHSKEVSDIIRGWLSSHTIKS